MFIISLIGGKRNGNVDEVRGFLKLDLRYKIIKFYVLFFNFFVKLDLSKKEKMSIFLYCFFMMNLIVLWLEWLVYECRMFWVVVYLVFMMYFLVVCLEF